LKRERDAKKSTAKFDEKDWVRLARDLRSRVRLLPRTETRLSASRSNATRSRRTSRRALRTEKMKPWQRTAHRH